MFAEKMAYTRGPLFAQPYPTGRIEHHASVGAGYSRLPGRPLFRSRSDTRPGPRRGTANYHACWLTVNWCQPVGMPQLYVHVARLPLGRLEAKTNQVPA